MTIFVVESYNNGKQKDELITNEFVLVEKYVKGTLWDDKKQCDFDVVGYDIPKSVSDAYKDNTMAIYRNFLINENDYRRVNNCVQYYKSYRVMSDY